MRFDEDTHIRLASTIFGSYEGSEAIKDWCEGRRSVVHHLLFGLPEDRKAVAEYILEMRRNDRSKAA